MCGTTDRHSPYVLAEAWVLCYLLPFEILHRPFVLLSGFARVERAEVSALPCLRIFLARIETVLSRFQFSNHNGTPSQLDHQLNSPKRTMIIELKECRYD